RCGVVDDDLRTGSAAAAVPAHRKIQSLAAGEACADGETAVSAAAADRLRRNVRGVVALRDQLRLIGDVDIGSESAGAAACTETERRAGAARRDRTCDRRAAVAAAAADALREN